MIFSVTNFKPSFMRLRNDGNALAALPQCLCGEDFFKGMPSCC